MISRILTVGVLLATGLLIAPPARAVGLLGLCEENLAAPKRSPELSHAAFHESFAIVQAYWKAEYAARGWPFEEAKIEIYDLQADTPCGALTDKSGPLFCSDNLTIYISPGFFDGSEEILGAPTAGFREYLIAHEYGHHLQRQRDERLFESIFQSMAERESSGYALMRKVELQADCLAGVFLGLRGGAGVLGASDLAHALKVATEIGNEIPQPALPLGATLKDAYDHGTGRERAAWVKRGIDGMRMEACEPFTESIFGGKPAAL